MRISLAVTTAALPLLFILASAQAQNYPWCAQYAPGGSFNCGFVTIQQCMAAISGNGGSCEANPGRHRAHLRPGGATFSDRI